MSGEQNITPAENENIQAGKQNPISVESSIPPRSQESTELAPENIADSGSAEVPSEATEASVTGFSFCTLYFQCQILD